ncbi:hypothetical protein QL285_080455 [Trifolium repens]|nr:hypothetical protein QL285_080455 [Trifolium repens]
MGPHINLQLIPGWFVEDIITLMPAMDFMNQGFQNKMLQAHLFLWEANGRSGVSMNYEEFDSPMAYQ